MLDQQQLESKYQHVWRALVSLSIDNDSLPYLKPKLEDPWVPDELDKGFWQGSGDPPQHIAYGTLDQQAGTLDEEEMDTMTGGEHKGAYALVKAKNLWELDYWLASVFGGDLRESIYED